MIFHSHVVCSSGKVGMLPHNNNQVVLQAAKMCHFGFLSAPQWSALGLTQREKKQQYKPRDDYDGEKKTLKNHVYLFLCATAKGARTSHTQMKSSWLDWNENKQRASASFSNKTKARNDSAVRDGRWWRRRKKFIAMLLVKCECGHK